jgi:hypothetical protein
MGLAKLFPSLLKITLQLANNSITILGITHMTPKKEDTRDNKSLTTNNKDKKINQCSTTTHTTPLHDHPFLPLKI